MPDEPDLDLPPNGDRRSDLAWRQRITEVLRQSIADRKWLRRHVRYVEAAVAVCLATLLASVAILAGVPFTGYGGLIGANRDRADESKRVADKLAGVVATIQSERERNIRRACLKDNRRHDKAVLRLDAGLELAAAGASPEERVQLKQSRAFTLSLINALVPHQDCDAVVERSIG